MYFLGGKPSNGANSTMRQGVAFTQGQGIDPVGSLGESALNYKLSKYTLSSKVGSYNLWSVFFFNITITYFSRLALLYLPGI